MIMLFTVVPLLPSTADDPPIVDFALGAAADRLITISDEGDIEDPDSDGGFWAGEHAANSQVTNNVPPNTAPRKN